MKLVSYNPSYRRVYIPVFKPVDVLAFIDPLSTKKYHLMSFMFLHCYNTVQN